MAVVGVWLHSATCLQSLQGPGVERWDYLSGFGSGLRRYDRGRACHPDTLVAAHLSCSRVYTPWILFPRGMPKRLPLGIHQGPMDFD